MNVSEEKKPVEIETQWVGSAGCVLHIVQRLIEKLKKKDALYFKVDIYSYKKE